MNTDSAPAPGNDLAAVGSLARAVIENVERVIVGKRGAIRLALLSLLARGHLLIEDVPGTGKTTLARALATSLRCEFRRIQFTPDLVPADVLGVSVYNAGSGAFEFRPGPVFTQILLADEVNRATPRTQSALLEAMQERQASVDGTTYPLPDPFFVIATQNPIEMDGTFRLPEAQLDRFALRVTLGYPAPQDELGMLALYERATHRLHEIGAVVEVANLAAAQSAVATVRIDETLRTYVLAIVERTRRHEQIRLGVSPRGSLALQRAAQAWAALDGRAYVLPDDVKALAGPVLAHRLLVDTTAYLKGVTGDSIVEGILDEVPVPIESESSNESARTG